MSSILQELIKEDEYRLFKISPKGIEEVDLDDILNDPEGFEEEMEGESSDEGLDSDGEEHEDLEGEIEGDDIEGEEEESEVDDDGNEIEDQFDIDFGGPAEYSDVDDMDFEVGDDKESGPYDLHSDNFDDDKSYNLFSPSYNRDEEPNLAVNNITGMDGAEDLDDEDFEDETDGELNWDKDLDGMEMAPDSAGDEPDEDDEDFDQDENHYGDDPSLMTHDKPSDFGPGGSLSRYQTDDFADGYFKDSPDEDTFDSNEENTDSEDNKDVNIDDEDEDSRLDIADSDLDFGFDDESENDEDLDDDEEDFEDAFDDEDLDDESEDENFDGDDDIESETDFDLGSGGETGDVDFDEIDTDDEDVEDLDDEESEDLDDMDTPESDEEGNEEDSDFQGVIRTVKGAALVYKRQEQDGTYTELWIYTRGDGDSKDMKADMKVRKAILAGTDIDSSTQMSDDGQQEVDTTSVGNVVFVKIAGLPQ